MAAIVKGQSELSIMLSLEEEFQQMIRNVKG